MSAWNSALVTRTMKRFMSSGALGAQEYDFRRLRNPSDWQLDFAGWRNTDWRAMRSYRQALAGFDVRNRLAEINVPVIVLHGDRDTLLPLDTARELSTAMQRAELRVVPGAGHALPLTHPDSVLHAINDMSAMILR
jgi:pimeloyl-ACP methyl ester carboxylesterase